MTTSIHDLINAEVEKATFTPDAIKRMADALEKVKTLEGGLKGALDRSDKLGKDLYQKTGTIENLKAKIADLENAAAGVAQRERDVTKLEKAAAVAEGQVGAYRWAMETVFRNATVKRTVMESGGGNGASGQYHSSTSSSTVTETQE